MVSYLQDCHAAMPPSDFDLYPSQEYSDLLVQGHYPPASNQPFTFGLPHQPHQPFSAPFKPQNNAFAMNPFKQGFLPYSPVASPASAAQSFDVCPPQLSSASESGASVHSTSSSAQGSPSMNQQFVEPWSVLGQGLGLAPGLEMPEFASCGFEYDSMVATDKHSGCVGESASFSSQATSSRNAFPLRAASSGALPRRNRISNSVSPRQSSPAKSTASPAPIREDELFKTPTTPASAMVSCSPSSASPSLQANRRPVTAMAAGRGRRNSLLSTHIWPSAGAAAASAREYASSPTPSYQAEEAPANVFSSQLDSSCRFPRFS